MEKSGSGGLILTLAFLVTVYVFVFGESGLIERYELRKSKERLAGRIEALKQQNAGLDSLSDETGRSGLLRGEALKAGYIQPGEKKIVFREEGKKEGRREKHGEESVEVPSDTGNLRILWIAFSALVVLFYLARKNRQKEGLIQ